MEPSHSVPRKNKDTNAINAMSARENKQRTNLFAVDDTMTSRNKTNEIHRRFVKICSLYIHEKLEYFITLDK